MTPSWLLKSAWISAPVPYILQIFFSSQQWLKLHSSWDEWSWLGETAYLLFLSFIKPLNHTPFLFLTQPPFLPFSLFQVSFLRSENFSILIPLLISYCTLAFVLTSHPTRIFSLSQSLTFEELQSPFLGENPIYFMLDLWLNLGNVTCLLLETA